MGPSRLGRYELLARLATGGMGEIFLARLEGAAGFEKLVVVKRILPHLADDEKFRQMLIGEARVASKMAHANICQVHELGETDGQLYIVMEYLEGVTLLPLLRKHSKENTALDLGFVGGVLQQICDALHYAHELHDRGGESLGIVHRDMTPSNIFLTDAGVAKVLDFGIAKVKGASAQTQTGAVKGKYAYMAPEQLRGAEIDRRVDTFALGVCAFEMLALRRLFQRKTDYLTFRAVMEQPIPDVRRYRPETPESVALAVAKALDRDPANRYQTARQFSAAILDGLSTARRVWSQGEISDFIRASFATDIDKRHRQVAEAVSAGRTMVTEFEASPDTIIDDPDDLEFPAVDSTVDQLPKEIRAALQVPQPGQPSDFAGSTPPPFGADSQTSGASLQPLVVPSPPRRSLVWPLLALAMVGIAGAALLLVYKQSQQQPSQGPVIIERTTTNPSPPDPPPPIRTPAAELAKEVTPPERPIAKKRITDDSEYKRAFTQTVAQHTDALKKCVASNPDDATPAGAIVAISPDGKATEVTLTPADANKSALGACLRNALAGLRYPLTDGPKQLTFPFVKKG